MIRPDVRFYSTEQLKGIFRERNKNIQYSQMLWVPTRSKPKGPVKEVVLVFVVLN